MPHNAAVGFAILIAAGIFAIGMRGAALASETIGGRG
jgi:hypothetical protein